MFAKSSLIFSSTQRIGASCLQRKGKPYGLFLMTISYISLIFFSFKAFYLTSLSFFLSRKMIKTVYLLTLQKKTAKKEEMPLAFSDFIKCDKTVTGSKLMLHTTWQMNKSRDEVLGQVIATLFREPADWETSGRVSPKNILPELEFRLLLNKKGKWYDWVLHSSWCRNSLFLQLSMLSLVTMFL